MRRIVFLTFLCTILIFSLITQVNRVRAQASSAQDLVNAVNAVRANHDLPPYIVDPGLMAFAQSRSEYQASIRKVTHVMADGSGPADHGVFENIGGGQNASASTVVARWSDYWHQHTMIGFSEGYIGAGVATADGFVYYTLVVRRTGGFTNIQPTPAPGGSLPQPGQETPGTTITIATVTPGSDGAVVHRVEAGQTLWNIAIAYEISTEDLVKQNGLDINNPVIYQGQELIIQPAYTPTPTPTETGTVTPVPTATATRRPTRTPRLTTPTPVPETLSEQLNEVTGTSRGMAIGITLVIGISLLLLVTFVNKSKK
jgi:LysM repeat protein